MARGDLASMAPQRRGLLLRTAAREFAEAGYERASLNQVIKTCGMSKSSFYHYLDSKEALFDIVVTEAAAAMFDALDVPEVADLAREDVDFWTTIERLLEHLVEQDENDWFEDFGRMLHLADAPTTSSLARILTGIHTWVEKALEIGRTRAAVRDDLPADLQTQLALAVLQAMDRWSLTQDTTPRDPSARHHLAAAQLDALRRLLDPTIGTAKARPPLR